MPEEVLEASSFEDNVSKMLEQMYTPAWVGKRRTMEDNKPKSRAATFSDNVNKVFLDMYLPPFLRDRPDEHDLKDSQIEPSPATPVDTNQEDAEPC